CVCSRETDGPDAFLGLPVHHAREAVGCPSCSGTGYRGRLVLAEILIPHPGELGRAILSRTDVNRPEALAVRAGMVSRWDRAYRAVEAGQTSPAEVRRVLGFSDSPPTASG